MFNLKIKNVGMNTLRKCSLKIKSDILSDIYCVELDEGQGSICKDEEKAIQFLLILERLIDYNFKIEVYYQDLLFNWYKQNLNFKFKLLNNFDEKKKNYLSEKFLKVEDEILLRKAPKIKSNIKSKDIIIN